MSEIKNNQKCNRLLILILGAMMLGCSSYQPTPGAAKESTEVVEESSDVKRIGKGAYRLEPSRGDRNPPEAKYRTG